MSYKINIDFGPMLILQIVFVVLKFCKIITWSWPVVLIPLWISIVGAIIAIIIVYRQTRGDRWRL